MWLRSVIGDKAFAFALLRHGMKDYSDLEKCAKVLRHNESDDGGVSQSARHKPNPQLREAALEARKREKYAKKCEMWMDQGWWCNSYQERQIMLLQTGELAKRRRAANTAYGFGHGAPKALSREDIMLLEVFTNDVLNEYMKQDE